MKTVVLQIPTNDFKLTDVPGFKDAQAGTLFAKVTDLPKLDQFMEVNPRLPTRTRKGSLSGPVVRGILHTLNFQPEEMSIKNQGIYLLVKDVSHNKDRVAITLNDESKHGIVNGGHTYAAIREAIENADSEQLKQLEKAYVQIHIIKGIPKGVVPDIAEGLNRSKQVDDLSLMNLQGAFEQVRQSLRGSPGEFNISYHQGGDGIMSLSEVLVIMEMFNFKRFDANKGPSVLYSKKAFGLKYFRQDMVEDPKLIAELVKKLPEILLLSDRIRKYVPFSAKKNKFKFGMVTVAGGKAGSESNRGTPLPYTGELVNYKVPNGWVYPILSAFRANLRQKLKTGELEWIVPVDELVVAMIDQLTAVLVSEHRKTGAKPERIGKSESVYNQCYSKVELYLARKNLL